MLAFLAFASIVAICNDMLSTFMMLEKRSKEWLPFGEVSVREKSASKFRSRYVVIHGIGHTPVIVVFAGYAAL